MAAKVIVARKEVMKNKAIDLLKLTTPISGRSFRPENKDPTTRAKMMWITAEAWKMVG